MKVRFLQDTPAGCVSFSLANFINDNRFISDVKSIVAGERNAEANKKLSLYQPDLFVETLFCTSSFFKKFPDRLTTTELFDLLPDIPADVKENLARPLLISFVREINKRHCIFAAQNLKDEKIYIFDSLYPERQVFTPDELIAKYQITTIEYFCSWNDPDVNNHILIRKRQHKHLFYPGE